MREWRWLMRGAGVRSMRHCLARTSLPKGDAPSARFTRRLRAALWAMCAIAISAPAAATVSATDDSGTVVTLPAPARRIVALAPHLTEQLFAIGAGARIVGTTDYADYPPAANAIPRVARAHSVDLERIAALKPDLVVVWGSGFPPATLQALRRLGVPLYVNEPGALETVASSLERLGTLTGSDGRAAARAFRERIDALRSRYVGRSEVRVFYQVWQQPLMTLSGRHVLSEAIRLCGGRNVFESIGAGAPIAPQVAIESVVAADPQLIATAQADARPTESLTMWKRFPALSAVRLNQFAVLDANKLNRHSPRMAEEIGVLCERIDAARAALR